MVRKGIFCRMRLISPNTQFDSHVADIVLYEERQCLHLLKRGMSWRGKRDDLLGDFRRGIAASGSEIQIPSPRVLPTAKPIQSRPAWRKQRNHHLAGYALDWRHLFFVPNC